VTATDETATDESATDESAPPPHPAPAITEDNQFYWEAARDGRLVAQRCGSCGRLRHPPRTACPRCQSLDTEIAELSGDGEIYSYALLWHPRSPRFDYPVIAILVDLAEGIRVVSNLVGAEPGDVRIGLPVTVEFQPCEGELAVPVFRPRTAAA
jgi:uncharacterized OB-fold protein